MRHLKLLYVFIRASLFNESAFRLNFFVNLFSVVFGLLGGIGGIYILYANNETLNGWTMPETLAVLGVFMLVQAIAALCINPSLNKLGGMGGELDSGTFDYTILRPINKQFYVSFREWSIWQLLHIAVSIGVIVFAVRFMDHVISGGAILLFLYCIIVSIGILYSITLFVNAIAFWYHGTYVSWIINDVMQAGRYPIGIYPQRLRLFLTWVFPLGFMVSVPVEALLHRTEPFMVLAGTGLMVVSLVLSSLFFRISLRKYSSASS